MNTLEEQYSSGKKIQRPSDDPIITVRALKLRTNLSEMTQYYEKNIPDAKSWMDVTESALTTVNSILKSVNTYCVQGSTDTLTASDRSSIAENLEQLKQQIYQEGNTNYAGRYVFTGYKTDSPLVFDKKSDSLTYHITQDFKGGDIQTMDKVSGCYDMDDFNNSKDMSNAPQMKENYRIQLAYNKLSTTVPNGISYYYGSVEQPQLSSSSITARTSADKDAYTPGDDEVHYISDTGELILGSNIYNKLRTADKIELNYTKTGFEEGELKPEHYFDCTMEDSAKPELGTVQYKRPAEGQKIQYEVNYNQKLTINTEGSDAITHQIGRSIDDILNAVNAVTETESKITEADKLLASNSLDATKTEQCKKYKEQLETELELKKEAMQKAFTKGITDSAGAQDMVNTAVADLGSRAVRLDMTENRLSSQKVDFEDLLSKNEDADVVETYINYNSAQNIYNASLSAAAKVVKNSLLDYL
jgi:flagellar hook-associated protein 3 FlgL